MQTAVVTRGGAVATRLCSEQYVDAGFSLTTTGVVLTEGKHYWEVELLSEGSEGRLNLSIVISFEHLLYPSGVSLPHRHQQARL